jgi:hypothetical protein
VSVDAPTTSCMPGRGTVFVFVDFLDFDLGIFDVSISSAPRPCLGGDGAACPPASPNEGRWVPHPFTLARQHSQEAARPAPASPLVAGAEAQSPEPDIALPQGKGARGTTTTEPLIGKGGTAGSRDATGARALPLTQLKAPCAVSPCIGSQRVEGGANGGVTVSRHPDQVPRGVNTLGRPWPL